MVQARRTTYRETLDAQLLMLSSAETLLKQVRGYGVRGQHRDLEEILGVNRSALEALDKSRGLVLERRESKCRIALPPTGQSAVAFL